MRQVHLSTIRALMAPNTKWWVQWDSGGREERIVTRVNLNYIFFTNGNRCRLDEDQEAYVDFSEGHIRLESPRGHVNYFRRTD